MKITIINTTNNEYKKADFLNDNLTIINTSNLKIGTCLGCFDCWVKTPGKCIIKDDMDNILRKTILADLVIYITDVLVGYISGKLKLIHDRTLPLIHPYMDIYKGEFHHLRRYPKYPRIGLVLIEKKHKIEDEVYDIIKNGYERLSYNVRSELLFVIKDSIKLGGLKNELSNY